MKNKIKIFTDDDPMSIISKINDLIGNCGLEIIYSEESGDGWEEYELHIHDQTGDDICE